MKKKLIWLLAILFGILLISWLLSPEVESEEQLYAFSEQGDFEINIATTGELEAKNSVKIYGPVGARKVRIHSMKIEEIVPDGTVVDSGDFVASLDKSELANSMTDQELTMETIESQLIKTRLDTTMTLRAARDQLINLEYALEERQIEVDQSIYEPPATQRQAAISLNKARRDLSQARKTYLLQQQKAVAEMVEVTAQYKKAQNKYDDMLAVLSQFTVMAPKSGMLVYKRDWSGNKVGVNAQISSWDPVVATLPDLTDMITKTYVNEVDISKVHVGQEVEISIDAFPDRTYTGEVTEVANIGEQLSNSNAKVFEVVIDVHVADTIMRPAMTTKTVIKTALIEDVVYVPLETVFKNDSISYVIKSDNERYQVMLGRNNSNNVIVLEGVEKGDKLYLTKPSNIEDFSLNLLDPEVIAKYEKKLDNVITNSQEEKHLEEKHPGKEGMRRERPEGGRKPKKQ